MPFKTPGKTSEYIRSVLPTERDEDIRRVTDYADEAVIPVLLPETAAFLRQAVLLSAPAKILEIGTAVGYSAHVMLKACPRAHLYTVEVSETLAAVAKRFLTESGLADRATFFIGDAAEIVPLLSGTYDFIFLDGAKTRYIEYWPYLKNVLAPGGVLVADNVLFNGMVDGSRPLQRDKASIVRKLDEFVRAVAADRQFAASILPVGDGVLFAVRSKS